MHTMDLPDPFTSPLHDQTKVFLHKYSGEPNNDTHPAMIQSQSNMGVLRLASDANRSLQDDSVCVQKDNPSLCHPQVSSDSKKKLEPLRYTMRWCIHDLPIAFLALM